MTMTKEAGTDQVGERLVLPFAPASLHSDEAESDSPTGTRQYHCERVLTVPTLSFAPSASLSTLVRPTYIPRLLARLAFVAGLS